jgi:uncharacterized membrane protein
MLATWHRLLVGTTVAIIIAAREHKKNNLSRSGCFAAIVVGAFHLAAGILPAVLLLTFFFTSSLLTKCGRQQKIMLARNEAPNVPRSSGRSAMQVLFLGQHVLMIKTGCCNRTEKT